MKLKVIRSLGAYPCLIRRTLKSSESGKTFLLQDLLHIVGEMLDMDMSGGAEFLSLPTTDAGTVPAVYGGPVKDWNSSLPEEQHAGEFLFLVPRVEAFAVNPGDVIEWT